VSAPLNFLTIGHVSRDLQPDGSSLLGGTVSFAALTAYRLGLVAGIVTRAAPEWLDALPSVLPGIAIFAYPSEHTTTFTNQYRDGFRVQYLDARADDLVLSDISAVPRADIVLLGPLAQEIPADMVIDFPRHSGGLVAATPQGWLRRWDSDGRVWPTPWQQAESVLPTLDVLILSHDDLLPFANDDRAKADAIISRWSLRVPLLVATDGRHGATLFRSGRAQHFPAFPTREVDPTGAGDVFAAAFLIHLQQHHQPENAVIFANCVAAFSIEQQGLQGIPSRTQVERRLDTYHF
jgi:1D-myo-inositol 3-kinase